MASLKDLVNRVKQYFNPIDQNKYVDTFFNKVSNTPRFQLPQNFLPQSNNKVVQFGQGIVRSAIESPLNIPRNLVTGYARIQKENLNLQRGKGYNVKNALAGVGNLAESALDLSGVGIGTRIAKTAGRNVLDQGFKNVIKRGVAQGAVVGAVGGGSYGMGNQYNKQFDVGEVAKNTVGGALLGSVLGGATSGLGSVWKMTDRLPQIDIQLRDSAGRWVAGQRPVKPKAMPQKQWEFQINFNNKYGRNPYEPVMPSDLQQAVKIEAESRIGMQVRDINKNNIPGSTKSLENMPLVEKTGKLSTEVPETSLSPEFRIQQQQLSQTPQMLGKGIKETGETLDDIISQGRKQIGGKTEEPYKTFRQSMDELYTQWVDRYNPIVQASQKAKGTLKGSSLRPEYDPEYLVRRLTGAGGIADQRYKTQLEPIIKEVEKVGIPKLDIDTYLANKRMAGFGKAGRDIYGVNPEKSAQIVGALESKYPQIGQFADQLYGYQRKGFQEMVDAGFISPENAKIIQGQNPDYAPLKRVMDEVEDYLGLPTRKAMQGTQPIAKIKGSKRQIESPLESIIGNTFSQRAAIEKNRVAKSITGLQNITEMGFSKVPKSAEDTITVWNNGQKEYWKVGQDIAEVAKGVNEEAMNFVLKVLQAPASLLRQGATGRNPEFMGPNIIRDQLDAGISSKYGYIPFVDYLSGLRSMISKDDIYQKWANSGAKIDLGEMSGKKSIQASFDTTTKKKGLFRWLGGVLDTMGKYSEQPTRIGLFKKAYKKTGNDLLSAMESRDSTVDFARMGSKMKVANSIIPFLNVGIQGFDKLIRAVKNNPGKVLLNASVYGTAPAITTTLYNLLNHPKEYEEIPQYEKDSNFILVKGRNENGTVDYLSFPKGNIIPTITNPIESLINYIHGSDQQSFKEMVLSTLSSTLPVVGDGQSVNEIAIKTIGSNLPQAIKPITENLINKSFYKYDTKKEENKDIVPSYLKNKEPFEQTFEFTPQMYQKIGQVFNASPLKIKNLMEGYLAGYAKVPAQIIEMMHKSSKGEEVSPNEKTFIRRFIKQTYPTSEKPASDKVPENSSLMKRLDLEASASEKPSQIFTYKDDKGKSQEIDISFPIKNYTPTGNELLDKERVADYRGSITTAKNNIIKALDNGGITQERAIQELERLQSLTKNSNKGRKPKKISVRISKPKTVKIAKSKPFKGSKTLVNKTPVYKISKARKPKNITIAVGKSKVPAYKIKKFRNTLATGTRLA